ncbi:hypothetical protein BCR37DRAFT_389910 [Protomyces lactucae-debilis]|uniref:Uncharacterized protein n=1 Tax=Protomyces lactucae-debilis TaxID=2754530 RepID=A0A1Y2ES75_PROLT|nr:uncharacterized protein BCR37DRAFT_389910 [Protomyces lactucae-debilis]ORY74367.1 hypothetical protein BCR37DRAFT_389910 [Protomyces lactucae-debilis]
MASPPLETSLSISEERAAEAPRTSVDKASDTVGPPEGTYKDGANPLKIANYVTIDASPERDELYEKMGPYCSAKLKDLKCNLMMTLMMAKESTGKEYPIFLVSVEKQVAEEARKRLGWALDGVPIIIAKASFWGAFRNQYPESSDSEDKDDAVFPLLECQMSKVNPDRLPKSRCGSNTHHPVTLNGHAVEYCVEGRPER